MATGPSGRALGGLSDRVRVLEHSLADKVNAITESEGVLRNRITELEVSERSLQHKVDDLTARSALHCPRMQRQRLDERLYALKDEVRTMSQEKERGERVWRVRLQRCQAQLKAKEEEMARQSHYFEHFKSQLQQKLSLSRERERDLQGRIHLLERRLLELTVSAASAAAPAPATRGAAAPERLAHLRGEGEGEEGGEGEEEVEGRRRGVGRQSPPKPGTLREREREGGRGDVVKGGEDTEDRGMMKRGAQEARAGDDKEESGGEARLRGFILSLQEDLRALLEREEQGEAERRGLAEQLQEAQENGHFLSCKMEEMQAAVHRLKLAESSLTEEVEELQEENLRLRRSLNENSEKASQSPGPEDPSPDQNSTQTSTPVVPQSSPPLIGHPGPLNCSKQGAAKCSQEDDTVKQQTTAKPDSSTLPLPKPDLLNLSGHRSPKPKPSPKPSLLSLATSTVEVGVFSLSQGDRLGDWGPGFPSLDLGKAQGSEETEALREAYRSLGGDLDGLRGQRDQRDQENTLLHMQQQLQRLSLENARLKLQLRETAGKGASEAELRFSVGEVRLSGNGQIHGHPPTTEVLTPSSPSSPSDGDLLLTLAQDDLVLALNQENRALAERIQELLAHLELQEGESERELAQLRLQVSGLERDGARLEQDNQEQVCLIAELTRKTEDDLNTIMDLQQRLHDIGLTRRPQAGDAVESGCGQMELQSDRATGLESGQGDCDVESVNGRPRSEATVRSVSVPSQVNHAVESVHVQQSEPAAESESGHQTNHPITELQSGPNLDDRAVASGNHPEGEDGGGTASGSQGDRPAVEAVRGLEAEQEELLRSVSALREEQRELGRTVRSQTDDKHQLTRSLWVLKEERDQVTLSLQALKQEREQLTRSFCGVREERDKMTRSLGSLKEERDRLSQSVSSLKEEQDHLASERERERVTRSLHGLEEKRDQVERSLRILEEERDQLTRSMCALTEERDALVQSLSDLEKKRDRLATSLCSEKEKKDQLTNSLHGLREERDRLQTEVTNLQTLLHSEGRSQSQVVMPTRIDGDASDSSLKTVSLSKSGQDGWSGGRDELSGVRMVREEEGESGRRAEGQSRLMKEVEAMGAELRRTQEELQRSQSEVQRCYHDLDLSEAKRMEAEKRAEQGAKDMKRMREGAKEEEEENRREHDRLITEVREMHDRVVKLQREKSDVVSLKAQAEEHLSSLQAQLDAKMVTLQELNLEYTTLRRETESREEHKDTLISLRARYDDIRAKYDVLLRKKSQTDLDLAPLKAKLSCLVVKCQQRNRVLAQMMRALRRSGCKDLPLILEAEDLLNDTALQDYTSAFSPGHKTTDYTSTLSPGHKTTDYTSAFSPGHKTTDYTSTLLPGHKTTDYTSTLSPGHRTTDYTSTLSPGHRTTDYTSTLSPGHRTTDYTSTLSPGHRTTDYTSTLSPGHRTTDYTSTLSPGHRTTDYTSTLSPGHRTTDYTSTLSPGHRTTDYTSTLSPGHKTTDYTSTLSPGHKTTDYTSTLSPGHKTTDYTSTLSPGHRTTDYTSTLSPGHKTTDYTSTLSPGHKTTDYTSTLSPGHKTTDYTSTLSPGHKTTDYTSTLSPGHRTTLPNYTTAHILTAGNALKDPIRENTAVSRTALQDTFPHNQSAAVFERPNTLRVFNSTQVQEWTEPSETVGGRGQTLTSSACVSEHGDETSLCLTSADQSPLNTPLTQTSKVGPVRVAASADRRRLYQEREKGEASERCSSAGARLSSPEKIMNLQLQLQKTLLQSYQAPVSREEAEELENHTRGRASGRQPRTGLSVPATRELTLAPRTTVNVPISTAAPGRPNCTPPIPPLNESPVTSTPKHASATTLITEALPTTQPASNTPSGTPTATSSAEESSLARNTPSLVTTTITPSHPGSLTRPTPRLEQEATTTTTSVTPLRSTPASPPAPLNYTPLGLSTPTLMAQTVRKRTATASFKTALRRAAPTAKPAPDAHIPKPAARCQSAPESQAPGLPSTPTPTAPPSPERQRGVSHPSARSNTAKQEAPAEVGSVDVIKTVGKSSLMIGWERPALDELGCSNGTFVYGYRIHVNREFHKSVMSSACTKCILENLDLCGPVHISVQTLGSNGLCAAKVSTVYRIDPTHPGSDRTLLRSDPASFGQRTPITHDESGSNPPPHLQVLRDSPLLERPLPCQEAKTCVAVYSYCPLRDSPNLHSSRELALQEGDTVTLLGNPRRDGFCEAELNGRRGLAPVAFLEEVSVPVRAGSPASPPSTPGGGSADHPDGQSERRAASGPE